MRVYLTWFILILACSLSAQEELEHLSFYLAQFTNSVGAGGSSISALGKEYKAPWIDRMEVRTETRDWELQRQQYQFRLRPSTPKIRKYQKQVYNDLLTELAATQSQIQVFGVKKIYEDWLAKIYEHKRASILANSISYYNDLIKVLSTTNQKGEIDALEIIKVKIDKEEAELKIKNLQKALANSEIENSLISVDEIRGQMKLRSDASNSYPSLASDLFDLKKIDHQYELEKAEKNQFFQFAQMNYRGPHSEIWEERVSLGLAFRIPRGERTNFDIIELQIEKMMEEEQIKERKLAHENKLSLANEELQNALDEYDARVEIQKQLSKYDEILENYNPKSKEEILDLISLKLDAIDVQLDLIRLEENIYEEYIDFLDSRSILTTQPTISHLTK